MSSNEKLGVTIYDSQSNQIRGEAVEVEKIHIKSLDSYDLCHVPSLGFFAVDRGPDYIKRGLRKKQIWEPHIHTLIKRYAKPHSIVVDVGAHIGTHTLALSQAAGDLGTVYCFEPQLKLFSELLLNIKINKLTNIQAYRAALGDSSKVIQMNPMNIKNEGSTQIGSGGESAPMIKLDDLCLENVSLIKIDIETAELDALKGSYNTIIRNRPFILIEILEDNVMESAQQSKTRILETIKLLSKMGYAIFNVFESDYLAIPMEKKITL